MQDAASGARGASQPWSNVISLVHCRHCRVIWQRRFFLVDCVFSVCTLCVCESEMDGWMDGRKKKWRERLKKH